MLKNSIQSKTLRVPTLRFPGFDGPWEEKRLGEVFPEVKSGKDKPEVTGEHHVYGSTGIIGNSKHFTYDGEYILIARVGVNAGRINRVIGKFGVTDNTLVLDKQINSNIDFYYYLLNKINLNRLVFGSGQPLVTSGHLKKVKVISPVILEQQKIADFLGSVDSWIENLRMQKEAFGSYKKGMMQKIFSQEIRFKDDSGEEFPKWEEKRLGEIGKSYNGLSGKTGEDFGVGEPFVTYKQIFDSSVIDVQKFALVKVGKDERQSQAKFADIFFTTSSETPNEVGFASVLLDKDVSPYLNSFSFGLRFNSLKEFDPYFAKFFFRCFVYRKEVVKLAQGSTRYNISKVGKYPIY
jgi:type I restriction enzyme S subunit